MAGSILQIEPDVLKQITGLKLMPGESKKCQMFRFNRGRLNQPSKKGAERQVLRSRAEHGNELIPLRYKGAEIGGFLVLA